MDAGRTFLCDPGQPAIGRRDDATVSTDCPTMRGTVRGEGNRVEMIFGRRVDLSPFLAAIFRDCNRAARADNYRAPGVLNVKSIKTHDHSRVLARPLKAAVRGIKNHSVCAHRPTVALVTGETDRADGVTLRSRVLPLPAAVGGLRQRRYCGNKQE